MKHLLLLRHAEAEQSPPGLGDFDRMLTERGHAQAQQAATSIAATALSIDIVLASPARRARDTISIVAETLGLPISIDFDPHLYLGSPDALLQALRLIRPDAHTVLLVGHNPGISELAQQLGGSGHDVSLRTAGLCHLTFAHADWDALGTGKSCSIVVVR
jgi:phosphohistidine phosphatase